MQQVPEEMQMGQAQSMSAPKRWPLVTQPSNRSTSFLKDSRLVNCYAERSESGYEIEKRFGLGTIEYQLSAGIGQGMINEPGAISKVTVMVANNTLYTLGLLHGYPFLGTVGTIITSAGAGLGNGGMVKFVLVPQASGNCVVLGSGLGGLGYVFSPALGLQTITDPNYPGLGTVPGWAYLDGTTYVMDNQANIWGSALNDPTTWNALSVIQANSEPDVPVALAKQLVYVVALKSTSVQIFYDAGNPTGSPLSPVPGALIKYGCLDANTLQDIDGILLWVTNDVNNVSQVGMMENLQFKIISTPAIDRFLNLTTQASQYIQEYILRSFSFKFAGHRFYGITNVTANVSLVYDLDQHLWYQWTDANGNFFRGVAVATDCQNRLLLQDYLTGAVNLLGPDYTYPSDNGVLFPVDIYTPNFDAGVDRVKMLSQMRFNADQTAGSKLWVRHSDNDYTTWTNFRQVDLSRTRPLLNDEGSFYRRAYHFRHMANTALRIRSVDLQMDIGVL